MHSKNIANKIIVSVGLGMLIQGVAQAKASEFDIDPSHAAVYVSVNHKHASTTIVRLNQLSGKLTLDLDNKVGKADVSIAANTVSTGLPSFDDDLKQNYIHADKFPTIHFTSDKFEFDGKQVKSVSGQLTLMGKKLPITLKTTQFNCYDHPVYKKFVCGADFETAIKRSEWGLTQSLDKGVPDELHIFTQIEAIQANPS